VPGLSKLLMVVGAILFIIGLVMPFLHLGKLPGDIIIKKGNTTVYFPIITSIVVSIVISLVLYFIGKLR